MSVILNISLNSIPPISKYKSSRIKNMHVKLNYNKIPTTVRSNYI